MKTQFTIGIALSCIGVAQAGLTLLLSNSQFFKPIYRRLLSDLTKTEAQFKIADFFHTEDPGGYRLDKVAVVSSVAGIITSQCISLFVSALGGFALAWVAIGSSSRNAGWIIGCLIVIIGAFALTATLLYRASTNKLQTFGMGLHGGTSSKVTLFDLNSPSPYLSFQFLAVVYAAVMANMF